MLSRLIMLMKAGVIPLVDAADFDGTNDYMLRGAGLTGAADSKTGIFSCWYRVDGGGGANRRLLDNAIGSAIINHGSDNKISFEISTSGAGMIANTSVLLASSAYHHILCSWNVATAGTGRIYVDDVSDFTSTLYTDVLIDLTTTDWSIGSTTGGTGKLNGCLAEYYFAPGQYLDFNTESNRRKFISATKRPVNLGADGSTPTGTAPIIFQRVALGAAASTFATNLGSGGSFTITGTLDIASTSP